ncbi:MAG: hypothetical protein ACXVPY_04455 [Bacteroidia bacterium]
MKNTLLLFALTFQIVAYSQNDAAALHALVLNDSSSAQSLFSYPDSIRNEILIASTYPQGFAKLGDIQKNTSTSFKNLVSKYNHTRQKQFWGITQYPELAPLLIKNKDKKKEDLEELLKDYPKEIKNASIYFVKHNYDALVQMKNIRDEFELKYADVIKDFPPDVKNSYNILLNYPELVSTLSEDLKTTRTIGELYKRNPAMVKHVADSVHQQIAKDNNAEYEDWKTGIKNDPNVQKDLKQLSKKYEKDTRDGVYEDDVYATSADKKKKKTEVQTAPPVQQVQPYPYWAGYPYWYDYPYWYPYPWWYNMGFYWGNESLFFYGMPNYYFGSWYYNHPLYYNRYRSARNYFYNHYQGHRESNGGFNRSVRQWDGRNGGGYYNGGRGSGGYGGGRGGGMGGGGRRR